MLSLEPPFYNVGGILIYRDHSVRTQFYYTAPNPRIARQDGRMIFDLFAYSVELEHSVLEGTRIPEEMGAGFLTMAVECSLTENQRTNILRELSTRTGLEEDRITLYPVPYHKGTVSVIALDAMTQPGSEPAPADSATPLKDRPTFVEKIVGTGKPSFLGDLRSIFSLSLSQEGVVFLEGLYKDRAAPVGVVYDLQFYGLRPAVQAKIHADLSRIYKHFGGGLRAQYAWASAEIDAALEFLKEQGAFTIDLTTQAAGEEGQKASELALSLFKDRIVQEFFKPTVPAITGVSTGPMMSAAAPPAGTTPATTGTATTGATAGATPSTTAARNASNSAANTGAKVGLSLRFKQAEELKTIEYDFTQRSPEERSHAPQGFLTLLLSPQELEQRIHNIKLDSEFFETLEVLVAGPTKEEFEALNLRQVEAHFTYGKPGDPVPPETAALLFRADSTGDKTFALKRRGRPSLEYTGALTYEFNRARSTDTDSFRYEVPARPQTSRAPRINPYDDFGVLDVEIEPGRLHPEIAEIDLDLSYKDPGSPFEAKEHFRLKLGEEPAESRRWQVRTRSTEVQPYAAAATFILKDGATYTAPPVTSSEPIFAVDSPFKAERKLRIRPNVNAQQITQITVEVEYDDEASNYHRRLEPTINPPFESIEIAWPILDANLQQVRYRVTAKEPGFIDQGEWQKTDEPSILVGASGSRIAAVDVRLIGATFDEAKIDAVQLVIEPLLPDGTTGESRSLLFDGTSMGQTVQISLPPGVTLRYRYKTVTFKSTGQTVNADFKEMTDAMLIISTRSLAGEP